MSVQRVNISFVAVLSFLNVGKINSQDIAKAPLAIERPNYGVIFHRVGTVLNGETQYKHTFAIPLPKIGKANLQKFTCDTDLLYQEQCDEINGLINQVNDRLNIEIQNIQAQLVKAINMIDPISFQEFSTGNARTRRDTGHALGSEYCSKLSAGQSADSSEDDGTLLTSIGNVVSDIFGTPTSGDIKAIASHICDMAKLSDLDEKEIHQANDRLTSMSNILNDRITNLKTGIKDAQVRISSLNSKFLKVVQETYGDMNALEKRIIKMEGMLGVLIEVQDGLNKVEETVDLVSASLDKWISAINHLTTGYLPPYFVSVSDITNLLKHIKTEVLPKYDDHFTITHKNPSFYYQLRSLTYTRTGKYLMIMVTVPIHAIGGVLAVYRVDTTHLSLSLNDSSSTFIHGLPDYFATTLDTEYYTEISAAHYSSCRGENLKICSSETSLKRSTQKSCVASIFYDSSDDIMEKCDIRYEESVPPGHAIQLSNHKYFVHSSYASETWQLVCPQANLGFNEQNIESCNSCIIQVPCFCKLLANDFIIPYQLTECKISDPQYPQITYHYGINLPVLHSLFPRQDLNEIKGDILKENSKWKIPLPTFTIKKSSNWEDVVAKDHAYQSDFKKVIAQHKNKTAAYATKADFLLKKAEDFSDLADINLKKIQNDIGGESFLHIFTTPKSMIGGISTSVILNIITLIISFIIYNIS